MSPKSSRIRRLYLIRKWGAESFIAESTIRRVARRGGVKRISNTVYRGQKDLLRIFAYDVLKDIIAYGEHDKRKTVIALDVVRAIKRSRGQTLYGFGASL